MKNYLSLALLTAALVVPASAQLITPSPITVVGVSTGVTSKFTLNFDVANNRLTVGIDNNVVLPSNVQGRLTGFALDLPTFQNFASFSSANVSIFSATGTNASDWNIFGEASQDLNVNGLSFNFDLGVGTGSNINGGGGNGINFGSTASITLQFGGDVTAADVSAVQNYYSNNQGDFLAARWQSITGSNTQSDAGFDVPPGGSGGGLGFVPEPSTYGVFGAAGLLALMVVRRRR